MQPDTDTLDPLCLVVERPHHDSALAVSLSMQPDAGTPDLLYLLIVAPPHLGSALSEGLSMWPDADTLDLLCSRLIVVRPSRGSGLDIRLSMQPCTTTLDLLYLRLVVALPHHGIALNRLLDMQPRAAILDLLHFAPPHRDSAHWGDRYGQPSADRFDLIYLRLLVAPSHRDSAQGRDLSVHSMTLLLPPSCTQTCCPMLTRLTYYA